MSFRIFNSNFQEENIFSRWIRMLIPALLLLMSGVYADVIVNEIMQNPAAVADNQGEWFELYNSGNQDVDLNG